MKSYDLFILRHAKSAWDTNAPSDFQRPLNKRGKKAASYMGEYLASKISHPVKIVSSPALRAWQTAVTVSQALNTPEQEIFFPGQLYMASCKDIVNVLAEFHEDVKKIILIGHNPGLEELLYYLAKDTLPKSTDGKILPTATLAHIKFEKDWQHLDKDKGKLVQIQRPQ